MITKLKTLKGEAFDLEVEPSMLVSAVKEKAAADERGAVEAEVRARMGLHLRPPWPPCGGSAPGGWLGADAPLRVPGGGKAPGKYPALRHCPALRHTAVGSIWRRTYVEGEAFN